MIYLIYLTASSEGIVVAPIEATRFWLSSDYYVETIPELIKAQGFTLIAITNCPEIAKESDSALYPKWEDEEKVNITTNIHLLTKHNSWNQIVNDVQKILNEKIFTDSITTWMFETIKLLRIFTPPTIFSTDKTILVILDANTYMRNLNEKE
jgi:hypothetical protein